MSGHQKCFVTASLQPRAGTAALLRVVSILHSRGTEVHALAFEAAADDAATMTAQVTLGNVGRQTLRRSLLRPVEVIDVEVRPEVTPLRAGRSELTFPELVCEELVCDGRS